MCHRPTTRNHKLQMEKRRNHRKMKNNLCIPRFKAVNNICTIKTNRLSPMSLLERFREAVFRLMMLSALSKATTDHASGSPKVAKRSYYYPSDPHHSEAVADCIEFIKKSALTEEENRDSTASSSIDSTPDLVMAVPVM